MSEASEIVVRVDHGKTTVTLGVAFGLCAGLIVGIIVAVVGQNGIEQKAVESGSMVIKGKLYKLSEVHP